MFAFKASSLILYVSGKWSYLSEPSSIQSGKMKANLYQCSHGKGVIQGLILTEAPVTDGWSTCTYVCLYDLCVYVTCCFCVEVQVCVCHSSAVESQGTSLGAGLHHARFLRQGLLFIAANAKLASPKLSRDSPIPPPCHQRSAFYTSDFTLVP